MLHAHRDFARVIHAGLQSVARIVHVGTFHAGRKSRSRFGSEGIAFVLVFAAFCFVFIGRLLSGALRGLALRRCCGSLRLSLQQTHIEIKKNGPSSRRNRTDIARFIVSPLPIFSPTFPCIILISARWPVSTSVAKPKISPSWPAPAVSNRSFTIVSAPL